MTINVHDEFIIPIENFYVFDSIYKKRFLLKEMFPRVSKELSDNLLDAYDLSIDSNGEFHDFPSKYYEENKNKTLKKYGLPIYIPIEVTKVLMSLSDRTYYECIEMYGDNRFIISSDILQKSFNLAEILLVYPDNFALNNMSMGPIMNAFHSEINPKNENFFRKIKNKIKTK